MQAEAQTRTVHCEKHGPYEQKYIEMMGKQISQSSCPKCSEERDLAEDERQRQIREFERQNRIRHCVESFKVPRRFQEAMFDNYTPTAEQAQKIFENCKAYAANFDKMFANGAGLILSGRLGTGKTHLAIAIGKHVATHGYEARYTNLQQLVRDVRSTWDDKELSEDMVIKKYIGHDLLIIDEVGVQSGTDNERNILFEIINGRYELVKPTIVISNLTRDEIAQLISERSVDRITDGGGGVLVFNWHSYRNRRAA